MELKIDDEFQDLVPPLQQEEYDLLEKSILEEGCRDALVIWNGFVIDGHNRYRICSKHGIEFDVVEKEFDGREDTKAWIITNQFARRNLSPYQRCELALELEDIYKEKAKEKQKEHGGTAPGKTLNQKSDEVNTNKELSKIAGVSHDTMSKAKKIKKETPENIKQKLRQGDLTINKAFTYLKRQEVQEKAKTVEPPKGKYRIIYADPPWNYGDKRDGKTTGAEDHYPSMTINELCNLPITKITDDNAVLFLWVTSPLLEECFEVIKAWGFKYKTSFIWDKVKHNMGHYNSVRHELLLVCTKGSCLPDNRKLFDSVQSIEKTEHSKKPEKFRNIIDTIYTYGKKLELFARGKKDIGDWVFWGNEVKI